MIQQQQQLCPPAVCHLMLHLKAAELRQLTYWNWGEVITLLGYVEKLSLLSFMNSKKKHTDILEFCIKTSL